MLSVRIINVDHYMSAPIPELDVTYSEFRGSDIKQVPVIRIFGTTSTGIKTCIHVHRVFPYICIPYDGSQCHSKLSYQIAASLDKAINITRGNSNAQTQHVYKIVLVSGIPFYGFHTKAHQFLKIYFYKPSSVKQATSLLQNGAILNTVYQPHEAHVPFILQFFIDFNLYGMSFIQFKHAKFRRNGSKDLMSNISEDLWLPHSILPTSISQMEADVIAADIMNRTSMPGGSEIVNPGLASIWKDERKRRAAKKGTPLKTPQLHSQRPLNPPAASDLFYRERLEEKLTAALQVEDNSLSGESVPALISYPAETPCGSRALEASFISLHGVETDTLENEMPNVKTDDFNDTIVNEELVLSLSLSQQKLSQTLNDTVALDQEDLDLLGVLENLEDNELRAIDNDSVLGSQVNQKSNNRTMRYTSTGELINEDENENSEEEEPNWLDVTLIPNNEEQQFKTNLQEPKENKNTSDYPPQTMLSATLPAGCEDKTLVEEPQPGPSGLSKKKCENKNYNEDSDDESIWNDSFWENANISQLDGVSDRNQLQKQSQSPIVPPFRIPQLDGADDIPHIPAKKGLGMRGRRLPGVRRRYNVREDEEQRSPPRRNPLTIYSTDDLSWQLPVGQSIGKHSLGSLLKSSRSSPVAGPKLVKNLSNFEVSSEESLAIPDDDQVISNMEHPTPTQEIASSCEEQVLQATTELPQTSPVLYDSLNTEENPSSSPTIEFIKSSDNRLIIHAGCEDGCCSRSSNNLLKKKEDVVESGMEKRQDVNAIGNTVHCTNDKNVTENTADAVSSELTYELHPHELCNVLPSTQDTSDILTIVNCEQLEMLQGVQEVQDTFLIVTDSQPSQNMPSLSLSDSVVLDSQPTIQNTVELNDLLLGDSQSTVVNTLEPGASSEIVSQSEDIIGIQPPVACCTSTSGCAKGTCVELNIDRVNCDEFIDDVVSAQENSVLRGDPTLYTEPSSDKDVLGVWVPTERTQDLCHMFQDILHQYTDIPPDAPSTSKFSETQKKSRRSLRLADKNGVIQEELGEKEETDTLIPDRDLYNPTANLSPCSCDDVTDGGLLSASCYNQIRVSLGSVYSRSTNTSSDGEVLNIARDLQSGKMDEIFHLPDSESLSKEDVLQEEMVLTLEAQRLQTKFEDCRGTCSRARKMKKACQVDDPISDELLHRGSKPTPGPPPLVDTVRIVSRGKNMDLAAKYASQFFTFDKSVSSKPGKRGRKQPRGKKGSSTDTSLEVNELLADYVPPDRRSKRKKCNLDSTSEEYSKEDLSMDSVFNICENPPDNHKGKKGKKRSLKSSDSTVKLSEELRDEEGMEVSSQVDPDNRRKRKLLKKEQRERRREKLSLAARHKKSLSSTAPKGFLKATKSNISEKIMSCRVVLEKITKYNIKDICKRSGIKLFNKRALNLRKETTQVVEGKMNTSLLSVSDIDVCTPKSRRVSDSKPSLNSSNEGRRQSLRLKQKTEDSSPVNNQLKLCSPTKAVPSVCKENKMCSPNAGVCKDVPNIKGRTKKQSVVARKSYDSGVGESSSSTHSVNYEVYPLAVKPSKESNISSGQSIQRNDGNVPHNINCLQNENEESISKEESALDEDKSLKEDSMHISLDCSDITLSSSVENISQQNVKGKVEVVNKLDVVSDSVNQAMNTSELKTSDLNVTSNSTDSDVRKSHIKKSRLSNYPPSRKSSRIQSKNKSISFSASPVRATTPTSKLQCNPDEKLEPSKETNCVPCLDGASQSSSSDSCYSEIDKQQPCTPSECKNCESIERSVDSTTGNHHPISSTASLKTRSLSWVDLYEGEPLEFLCWSPMTSDPPPRLFTPPRPFSPGVQSSGDEFHALGHSCMDQLGSPQTSAHAHLSLDENPVTEKTLCSWKILPAVEREAFSETSAVSRTPGGLDSEHEDLENDISQGDEVCSVKETSDNIDILPSCVEWGTRRDEFDASGHSILDIFNEKASLCTHADNSERNLAGDGEHLDSNASSKSSASSCSGRDELFSPEDLIHRRYIETTHVDNKISCENEEEKSNVEHTGCDGLSSSINPSEGCVGKRVEKEVKHSQLSEKSSSSGSFPCGQLMRRDQKSSHSERQATCVFTPLHKPPSRDEVVQSLAPLGIPQVINQEPFYGNHIDVKGKKEVGGQVLNLTSHSILHLEEFGCSIGVIGLKEQQKRLFVHNWALSQAVDCLPKLISSHASLRQTIIKPVKIPPTVREVKLWEQACKALEENKLPTKFSAPDVKKKLPLPHSPGQLSNSDSDSSCDISESSQRLSLDVTNLSTHDGNEATTTQSTPQNPSLPPLSSPVFTPILSPDRKMIRKFKKKKHLKSRKCLGEILCSPINYEDKEAKEDGVSPIDLEESPLSQTSNAEMSDVQDENSLRRLLLNTQFCNQISSPRARHAPDVSACHIGSINNSHGFRMVLENLQDVKVDTEYQFLTVMTIELHVQTLGDLKPDPDRDPIRAIFYSVVNDVPSTSSVPKQSSGVLVVDDNSGIPLLEHTGVEGVLTYSKDEKALLQEFIVLVRMWDPDILAGFEVEMLSWGYLVQRSYALEINLLEQLSRVPEQKQSQNINDVDDNNGLGGLKLAGRIVLDVWRLLRSEVALQSYTFENVVYHILHQRVPLYSFDKLSLWWETSHNTRRITAQHYQTRVLGVTRLLEQLDLIGRTSELARLFGIQFFEVLSRGSQFRVESMMLRLGKLQNYVPVSPSIQQRARMRAPESLPLIMEPESRFYSDPVIVLDFQSLYPSIIIAYNYCFSTCLGRVEHLGKSTHYEFGCMQLRIPPKQLKRMQNHISISPCGVAFVSSTIRRGVLPCMLEEILEARLAVKQSLKSHKDNPTLKRVLHARQLGLKLIANVTYGYTSANFSGRMPCIEVGDSVVSKARETLEAAINLVHRNEDWRARVVYGDTDSMFVLVPGRSREEAFRVGAEIAEAVTQANPSPIKLKLEKVYQPSILQTKKRYVGYMYESPDQKEPVYDAKGIETVRRDGCPAVAKVLEKSLRLLFENQDVSLVKRYVCRQFSKLLEGRVSYQDLIYAREYRGMANYRPGACVPALELTRRWLVTDRRAEPRIGERVPYVIVNGPPGLALIRLVRHPNELIADPSLRINAVYYITRAIIPPLERCFSLIGADVPAWYADLPRKQQYMLPIALPQGQKKTTISQYFSTLGCACCGEQTHDGVCTHCRTKPQDLCVALFSKIHAWERSFIAVRKVCQSCTGRSKPLDCVSLDCPILYRRLQTCREKEQENHVRQLLKDFLPF